METKKGELIDDLDNYPVIRTLSESQPAPIVDNASATVVYVGNAPLGPGLDKPLWKISRITTTGTVTITEYADGNMLYDNVWNDRVTLTYSR